MFKIAKVIVDVPTMQTNRPYDYLIPENIRGVIQAGQRVVVPFGQGSRLVQGFVVGLTNHAEFSGDLKSIQSLMDLSPVLNPELLDLGQKMSDETFSFLITCYQTMLPSLLRAQYDKYIVKINELDAEVEARLFEGRDEISFTEATERGLVEELQQLKQRGLVRIRYDVKDKITIKTERFIISQLDDGAIEEELEELAKNANKLRLLLEILQKYPEEELAVKVMREEYAISTSTLNNAADKGWLKFVERRIYRDPYAHAEIERTQALTLTNQQQVAYEAITEAIVEERDEVFLLQGITGSGKTEVYLQTIAEALERGKTAVMLVPEIALTPLMVQRFKGRFGDLVAVLHSALSDGERYDEWQRIERGEAKIVVGARSSIFAPIEDIGIIIIDEEHETTYKQQDNPRYHARDVAKWRAEYHGCPVVLGSATPSLESRARALKGVYTHLTLTERPTAQQLPSVEVINLRTSPKEGAQLTFSKKLLDEIKHRVAHGEQSVLMLNRRGYSSFMMCRDCGFVLQCPNCDISQTLHMDTKTMKCHYCGHEEGIPKICPSCQSRAIRYYGTGTQKVEEELQDLLPEIRILRMDRDTTRRKGAHEKLLKRFENHEADVLLGTQMIAKGLDFSNVTLVGVLNADTSLYLPDFRASEKTFQLLTQVAGRAGRGDIEGEVYIQTYNPEHYAIQLSQRQDYEAFFKYEMNIRHRGDYPPYYYTLRISVSHENERQASHVIHQISEQIKPYISEQAIVLGPTPGAIARLQNQYHYQLIIKYKQEKKLTEVLHQMHENLQTLQREGISLMIERDPVSFL